MGDFHCVRPLWFLGTCSVTPVSHSEVPDLIVPANYVHLFPTLHSSKSSQEHESAMVGVLTTLELTIATNAGFRCLLSLCRWLNLYQHSIVPKLSIYPYTFGSMQTLCFSTDSKKDQSENVKATSLVLRKDQILFNSTQFLTHHA